MEIINLLEETEGYASLRLYIHNSVIQWIKKNMPEQYARIAEKEELYQELVHDMEVAGRTVQQFRTWMLETQRKIGNLK